MTNLAKNSQSSDAVPIGEALDRLTGGSWLREINARAAAITDEERAAREEKWKAKARKEAREDLAAMRVRRRRRFWDATNVPKLHAGKSPIPRGASPPGWDEVRREVTQKVRDADGRPTIIGILGGRGVGKTQIAVDVVFAETQRLVSAYFATASGITDRELWVSFGEDRTRWGEFERLAEYGLLVIDAWECRRGTSAEDATLTDLINERYQNCVATIIVSNEKEDAFRSSLGPSILSRIVEAGGIHVCDWPSFRPAIGAARRENNEH